MGFAAISAMSCCGWKFAFEDSLINLGRLCLRSFLVLIKLFYINSKSLVWNKKVIYSACHQAIRTEDWASERSDFEVVCRAQLGQPWRSHCGLHLNILALWICLLCIPRILCWTYHRSTQAQVQRSKNLYCYSGLKMKCVSSLKEPGVPQEHLKNYWTSVIYACGGYCPPLLRLAWSHLFLAAGRPQRDCYYIQRYWEPRLQSCSNHRVCDR